MDTGLIITIRRPAGTYQGLLSCTIIASRASLYNPNFKVSNVNDLISTTIIPVIAAFIHKTGRVTIQLSREKIILEDEQTCRYEEFVVVDEIAVSEESSK